MGSYHADSYARQTSTVTTDRISVAATLGGSTWVSLAGPYGPASSVASSIFEVSFGVLAPLEYQVDAFRSILFHDLPRPSIDFSLISATSGTILKTADLSASGQFSGIFLPDIYTLRFNASLSTVPDPLGDFKFVNYGMDLRVAGVPDNTPAVVLLLISFAGLIVVHRGVAGRARVTRGIG